MKPRTRSIISMVAIVGTLMASILAALWAFTPNVPRYRAIEGQPLLEQDGHAFIDRQIGLRFTPPTGWSIQARSTEAPGARRPERLVVKYKRLIPDVKEAWLRVTVAEAPDNPSPGEVLRIRKPREANWSVTKETEDQLKVGGRPAARKTFGGQFSKDSKGAQPWSSEVVAVLDGRRMYYFDGTFPTADAEARQLIRAAIESVEFD